MVADYPDSVDSVWQAVDWVPHTFDAQVRGRVVRYVDVGAGPSVVLIHGQGGSWQWWLRVIPAISRRARVIAIDLAGFGGSEPISSGDVFDEHVATVIGLLDHLRLAATTIVGHSMGGLLSLKIASDHPDRVAGLMLIGAGSESIGRVRLAAILAGFRLFDRVFGIAAVPRVIARRPLLRTVFFALAVSRPRCVTRALAEEVLPRMTSPGFIATMEAAGAEVTKATPYAVRCPALLTWGGRDRIVPLASGRRLAAGIPDARLVVLDDVGHCPMIERSDETASLITDFTHDPVGGRPTGEPLRPEFADRGGLGARAFGRMRGRRRFRRRDSGREAIPRQEESG